MNIDTLNAYCGNELVSFPYLAQGRLNIHRSEGCKPSGSHRAVVSALCGGRAASEFTVRSLRRLNSWT